MGSFPRASPHLAERSRIDGCGRAARIKSHRHKGTSLEPRFEANPGDAASGPSEPQAFQRRLSSTPGLDFAPVPAAFPACPWVAKTTFTAWT